MKHLDSLSKKNKFFIPLVLIVSAFIIFGAINVYYNELDKRIYELNIQNLMELAHHDVKSVEAFINTNWTRLEYISETITEENCKNTKELMNILEVECKTSDYERIAVLDDKGNIYSSNHVVSKMTEDTVEWSFMNTYTLDKIVTRYGIDAEFGESETLFYGIHSNIKVGNINIVAVFAKSPIKSIENNLRIKSYGNKGYTLVFNRYGNMVVNIDIDNKAQRRENFYTQLDQGKIEGGYTSNEIKVRNDNNESYVMKYTDKNDVKKIMYCSPVKNTYWTFAVVVPEQVFKDQSKSLVQMNVMLFIAVLIVFTIAGTIIYLAVLNAVRTRADAKVKSRFLSTMSHEIRTPLNGIIGLNELMLMHIDDKEKVQQYLSKNIITAEYLLSLVNDILDMSKLQEDKFEIAKEPFSLEKMLESIDTMQSNVFNSRGITFEIEKDIPYPEIMGDQVRVEQVLMNILSNAAKFTDEGGRTDVKISQKLDEHSGNVETTFVIADTGCGMSKEFLNQIFDAFAQERNKNQNSIKGTGLGMAISKLLVEQMGGTITVDSELGKGSTFTISLNNQICTDHKAEVKETQSIHLDQNKNLNILLAEDNELNAEILIELLKDYNFGVTLAVDGREVVEKFKNSAINEYDVILMDIQMPVLNGYDACKEIRNLKREDAKSVIIFACTANAFKEDEKEAYKSGMNGFITKPINVKTLLGKLGIEDTE